MVPNKKISTSVGVLQLFESQEKENAYKHKGFFKRAAERKTKPFTLWTYTAYAKMKKIVRGQIEVKARERLLNAKTDEQRFEFAQLLRDTGWLYYYALKLQADSLPKTSGYPEIASKFASFYEQHPVEHDFVEYTNKLLEQQKSKAFDGIIF
jgi:hypothetical protein